MTHIYITGVNLNRSLKLRLKRSANMINKMKSTLAHFFRSTSSKQRIFSGRFLLASCCFSFISRGRLVVVQARLVQKEQSLAQTKSPGSSCSCGPEQENSASANDLAPARIFVMRHAESMANVADPRWKGPDNLNHGPTGLPDPPLTPGHGREMAFAAGEKFANTLLAGVDEDADGDPHLLKRADFLEKLVFLVSPMRRAMETASFFIQGLAKGSQLAAEQFAGPAKIILSPDAREVGPLRENQGTEIAKWGENDPTGNPFHAATFFLKRNDSSSNPSSPAEVEVDTTSGKKVETETDEGPHRLYSWMRASDEFDWPDNGECEWSEDREGGGGGRWWYPQQGANINKAQNRNLKTLLGELLLLNKKGSARFAGKVLLVVSHSSAMKDALDLYQADGTQFAQDWFDTNKHFKQTIVFAVERKNDHELKMTGQGQGRSSCSCREEEKLQAHAVYQPDPYTPGDGSSS